jgi:hypothetical protein
VNKMEYLQLIFLASCFILFAVPVAFVANHVYDDGLFGRIGLLGIASAASMFLLEAMDQTALDVPPKAVLLTGSFALFMVWHLLRFHRRVLMRKKWAGTERRAT